MKKDAPDKNSIIRTTLEMAELRRKGLTFKQIGKKYGMTKQAVDDRFKTLKINPRPPAIQEKVDKSRLEKLYSEDSLSLNRIADEFGVGTAIIEKALKIYEIPKRISLTKRGRYKSFLENLEVGEKDVIVITAKYPHISMHSAAKRHGQKKISMKKIGENKFEITRLK